MGCGGCKPQTRRRRSHCSRKRKRLPSINPFFHFLKCVWRKFRGCKRSVVVRYAVKKWRRMSKSEKQPFFDAACRAQSLHRRFKRKEAQNCHKSCSPSFKPRCPKRRRRKPLKC